MLALVLFSKSTMATEVEFSGSVSGELTHFFQQPQFEGQCENFQPSMTFVPEIRTSGGPHRFTLVPHLRLDACDEQRTHFDLREAYWRYVGESWEIVAGMNRVFWGVTESRHLVDIINQTDLVENVDGEDKLGQQMINVSWQTDLGNLGVYVLPGFRERTFPGEKGRLRTPLPVDQDKARYKSSAGKRHVDLAVRYSHFIGDWDIGASYFYGTGREPLLIPNENRTKLIPIYSIISQGGIDLQYTKDAWLWKFEGIARSGQGKTFLAGVGGFEYTLYQVFNSATDIGVLVEYLYDGRDEEAPITGFDDDLFVGTRLALNDTQDTQALVGAIVDRSHGSTAFSVELERRIGEKFKLEIESRHFFNVSEKDVLSTFGSDDFTSVRLSWFF
jgi:hypothetical protein